LGIFFILIAVPLAVTRNIPLSMGITFLSLPFLSGFIIKSTWGTLLAAILFLLVGGKFAPTAIAAWKRSKGLRDFIFHDSSTPGSGKGIV
jgi:hypothetical protein